MSNIISKKRIREILASFMGEKLVAAPVMIGKTIDFQAVDDVSKILMGDEIPYKSPKEFFFPQCEKIITFKDDEAVAETHDKDLLLFGAKPCDLEALKILKTIFSTGQFRDDFFMAKYDSSLIVGVSCVDKKPGCFCELRETDMNYSESCDLFLKNAGDDYEVLYVSDKGRDIFGKLISLPDELPQYMTKEPSPCHIVDPEHSGDGPFVSNDTKGPSPCVTTLSLDGCDLEMFDKIDWVKYTETCQGCGLCTFICPTCHCFDFKDVEENGSICRYRNWDSCMFPKFTVHASGHNPRESIKERYRQRVLHKYSYIPKNFGSVSCTGCGRCIRSCPAGVNIKSIVEGIMEDLS